MKTKDLTGITKDYYNSTEADEFYANIWGGEHIHIGIYKKKSDSIPKASEQTIKTMIRLLPKIGKNTAILDLGSGYGGAARYLARQFQCKIDCLNVSERENERNEALNKEAELEEYITVTTGNFEQIPFQRETFDIVWSQDALLHSEKREKVFREAARVLKPEGRFIFTDPMQSDDCPDGALQNVLERLHLKNLSSVNYYQRIARKADLERVIIKEMPKQLLQHYTKILDATRDQYDEIVKKSGKEYIDKMIEGLQHWIEAAKEGYLNWGILEFQKRNT